MKTKSERGAELVEFAMVFPLLFIFFIGMIDITLMLYNKAVITCASREGCRAGIVAQDRSNTAAIDEQIQTVVNSYCQNHLIGLSSSSPVTTVTWPSNVTFGNSLEVNVTYNYGLLGLGNISGFANPFTLGAKTAMLLE